MRFYACSLIHLSLITGFCCANRATWGPANFSRWVWGTSTVVGSTLYLDAGEVYSLSTESPPQRTISQLGSTVLIDLTQSWSNSSLFSGNGWRAIDKSEDFQYSRLPWLWSQGGALYYWGGWTYFSSAYTNFSGKNQYGTYASNVTWLVNAQIYSVDSNPFNLADALTPTLWQLDLPSGSSNPSWEPASIQLPIDIGFAFGALTPGSDTAAFSLGGVQIHFEQGPMALPGLAIQNALTGAWSNISSASYGTAGYGSFGEAVYLPDFGSQGLLMFLGGFTPTQSSFSDGIISTPTTSLQSMAQIDIYDIASQTFISQNTSGDVPAPRWRFCAVGAVDSAGGGFDIFIHGGFPGPEFSNPLPQYDEDFANIFVLSVPSFTWTRIPGSAAVEMRAQHSCQIIGQSQMAVLGGDNPGSPTYGITPDPNQNGIGVWDMNKLSWSNGYNATAPVYARSMVISSSIQSNEQPVQWSSTFVESLFVQRSGNNTNPTGGMPQIQPQPSSSPRSPSQLGTIIGGAVGGAVLLMIIIAVIARKRYHRSNRVVQLHQIPDGVNVDFVAPGWKVGGVSDVKWPIDVVWSPNIPVELSDRKSRFLQPFELHSDDVQGGMGSKSYSESVRSIRFELP